MLIEIEKAVLEKYPTIVLGFVVSQVCVKKIEPFVEKLKETLPNYLQSQNITSTTFILHPLLAVWRQIYEEDFLVNAKTYRSSLESLVKRVLSGKSLWQICNVVDLYNCCSLLSLLPMGGYDLDKIAGKVQIRYAKDQEEFYGLGQKKITACKEHIVYADEERIICWLWNHKDAQETCIDEDTKKIIFFIDGFTQEKVEEAICLLTENLKAIGSQVVETGTLSQKSPSKVLISS